MGALNPNAALHCVSCPTRQQYLHVRLQRNLYAIPLEQVIRVMSLMAMREVPGSPPWVMGLMNYQGDSILAVDLAERLARDALMNYTLNTPVVLCEGKAGRVGLVVGDVVGIEAICEGDVKMEQFMDGAELPFRGAVRCKGGISLVLDIDRIWHS